MKKVLLLLLLVTLSVCTFSGTTFAQQVNGQVIGAGMNQYGWYVMTTTGDVYERDFTILPVGPFTGGLKHLGNFWDGITPPATAIVATAMNNYGWYVMTATGDVYERDLTVLPVGPFAGPLKLLGNFWDGLPTATLNKSWGSLKSQYR